MNKSRNTTSNPANGSTRFLVEPLKNIKSAMGDNSKIKLDSAVFYTSDLARAVAFYRDIIGFEVDYVQSDRYASFNLSNAKLGIKQAKEAREIPGHQTIFIECENIEEIYQQFKSKGVDILKELTTEDWAINFSILDPDGNKVQYVKRTKN
ncbi:MAG: hypothetical protein C0412_17665 [Flavobacterium sp.]|nr:hypothetical protein [Flavobacterium sp.]